MLPMIKKDSTLIRTIKYEEFPLLLKEIPDAPKKLFIEGELPDQEKSRWLAVVGARAYTEYGKTACEKIIRGLAGYPVVIVSGLALGIDAIAHRAALDAGLTTLAVPGSGLDPSVLYPATNRALARDIIAQGGTLLTEFEPMHRPGLGDFPQRNRIMAGLSHAVLIVEAEERSGSLITARLALDYNRDVFTIPGSIFSRTSAGPHKLLRMGALPITTSADILQALYLTRPEHGEKNDSELYSNCSPKEKNILELLREPQQRDVLIRAIEMPTHEANILLSAMELKGLLTEQMGLVCRA